MRLQTYIMVLFAACILVACGQVTIIPPGATAVFPSAAATSDVLVIYHKTGGLAGVDETFTVSSTGITELVMRDGQVRHGQISATELAALQQAIANSATTPAQTPQPMTVADGFAYELKLPASNGTGRVIKTVDGATNPPALQAMLALLDQLRARQG